MPKRKRKGPDRDELRKILLKEKKKLGDFVHVLKLFNCVRNGINEEDAKELKAHSKKSYHWKCQEYNCPLRCDHEWEGSIINTISRFYEGQNACPYCGSVKKTKTCLCNSLYTQRPDLVADWDYERNKDDPKEIPMASGKKVYWLCKKGNCKNGCLHRFKAPVSQRTQSEAENSFGCPYCSFRKLCCVSNSLYSLRPDIMEIWDFKKNDAIGLDPKKLRPQCKYKAHFICPNYNCEEKCQHTWYTGIQQVFLTSWCPWCSKPPHKICEHNSLAGKHPQLMLDWDYKKNKENPLEVYPGTNLLAHWSCVTCGHEWRKRVNERTRNGNRCPNCIHDLPVMEQKMKDLLDNLVKTKTFGIISYQSQSSRPDLKHINKLEFDFELKVEWSEKPIIIELDGQQHFNFTYWGGHQQDKASMKQVIKKFKYEATRDKIKNNYCKLNIFHLLRVSFNVPQKSYFDFLRDFLKEVRIHEQESPNTAYFKFIKTKNYEDQQKLWEQYEI